MKALLRVKGVLVLERLNLTSQLYNPPLSECVHTENIRLTAFCVRGGCIDSLTTKINECNQAWVLKKSLNRTVFHLRACRHRFSFLDSTKWWPAEPVLSAD